MTTCIPIAGGVPGLNEPPTWPELAPVTGHVAWPRGAPSQSDPPGLDDPRWRTATTIGFPDLIGGTEEAVFRAAYRDVGADRSLYVSWLVKVAAGDHSDDRLWVGFERSGAAEPLVLEITPFPSGGSVAAGNVAADVTPWKVPAGPGPLVPLANWDENGGVTPSWIDVNTHVWLATSDVWAVQMRVPVGTGSVDDEVDLATDFRMWFEMRVDMGTGVGVMPHRFPYAVPPKDTDFIAGDHLIPELSTWEPFHFSTGASDPACPTTGFVTISSLDIGTTNSPPSRIMFDDPAVTPPAMNSFVNTFEAKPLNLSGSSIPASPADPAPPVLSAEFRIANWGSQIGVGGTWQQIVATGGTENPARNTAAIADGSAAGPGNLTMDWTLNESEINQFTPGGSSTPHQCMLVTLSGAGLTFAPAAVYRNMDFVSASRFERVAEVSNVGLGPSPIPGQPRDTYIVIQRRNMPAVVESRREPPRERGRIAHGEMQPPAPDKALSEAARATASALSVAEYQEPTIRYHVYHDTGIRVTDTDGGEDAVLSPGVPFGYFVRHDGPLQGWSDTIQGAVQVSPKVYKLAVPEEGSATVTTTIEAIEPGGEPGGCGRWIAPLVRWLRRLLRRT